MTTVRKAKSAFLFYQGDQLSKIRADTNLSMGDAMTELATRWRKLSDEEKQPYLDQHNADVERYQRESHEADMAAIAAVEAKRQAYTVPEDGEDISAQSRGARAVVDADRMVREERRRQQKMHAANDHSEEAEYRRQVTAEKKREQAERRAQKEAEEEAVAKQHRKLDKEAARRASSRLEFLLKQSNIFARLQGGKGSLMGDEEGEEEDKKYNEHIQGAHHVHAPESSTDSDIGDDDQEEEVEHVFLTKQPSCIKFGQLKPYQLESLNWMIHLAGKGLNGILADEMGLGKTLQSISILAYHYEFLRIQGPHLVCVPKSTLSNWMNELRRWCPALRAIKFHGSREDREYMIENDFTNEAAAHDGRRPDQQIIGEDGEMIDDNSKNPRTWDVCVTTYEVANAEKRTLQKFAFKYLIIDEAHRLKNDASLFSQTVRSFRTANRLLLTGTPLQNNLHELWALLNFLLPDIFSSSEQFDEWFDLEIDDEDAKKNMISQLHKILRPFMLRRLKVDVAKGLPPKTETILMVGMSKVQKQLYRKLLLRDLDSITGNINNKNRTAVLNIVMQLRKCCGHPYLFEGVEDRTLDPLGEHLVENCGKLSMVDKLLKRLKERGSRVLIFTQMTRVLDILEDFMVMRGYKYCRIDGNTTYDDRESQIDDFNGEGSDKFCFILSTRAGGLGINLQTADTCILYDSDWNPQQDLQAQDRCHRLGQKKPVNVFRLVSENTIEEKIVERAQQKLKLDAMVVQQGRLKEQDKLTKEDILTAVRFGADTVFRSEESTITDDDIDVILEKGKAKTKEIAERIKKKEKGDLMDFKLDGGISAQTFEGVDYSDKNLRDHLRMLAAQSVGKRERRPPPASYNPIIISKKSMVVNDQRISLPKPLRTPQMEDHHFYNRERLLELGQLEFENYAALREANQVPPREVIEREKSLLPPELAQEKRELLEEGFGSWTRSQYYLFVKSCAKFGRDDIASIALDLDMPVEEVQPYSEAFWKYGPTELKSEWERVVGNIERGEKKLAKQKKLSDLLTKFVGTFENPREEMVFANKGTTHFALEQDRALLCAVAKHGYGNWDSVREEIRTDDRLKFQHSVQGMTVQTIAKRCDYRMRQMEKELEAREKALKSKRSSNVAGGFKAIEIVQEVDLYEKQTCDSLLEGTTTSPSISLSSPARLVLQEKAKDVGPIISRLREIEVQLQRALDIAEDTRQAIQESSQYVNYSNITIRQGTPATTGPDPKTGMTIKEGIAMEASINSKVLAVPPCRTCESCMNSKTKLCLERLEVRNRLVEKAKDLARQRSGLVSTKKVTKKRKIEVSPIKSAEVAAAPAIKKTKLAAVKPEGTKRPRNTSQGNKPMAIPTDLLPEFCRRIGVLGTACRMNLINEFVEDYPHISVRQVTIRFGEITTRERPECVADVKDQPKRVGRAFIFYLRPAFYKYLPESDRPPDWEVYAAEDERLYREEEVSSRQQKTSSKGEVASVTDFSQARSGLSGEDTEGEEDEDETLSSQQATSPVLPAE